MKAKIVPFEERDDSVTESACRRQELYIYEPIQGCDDELVGSADIEPEFVDEFIRRIEQEPRIIYKDHGAPDA